MKKEVQRWADAAMFRSEPMHNVNESGPKAFLLEINRDPLGSIASACKMYKGEVVYDLRTITDDERGEYLDQVKKTKLQMPFETVNFHFLLEGVTRSFTHQLVRQRTAAYAQESMRFAVVEAEDDWTTRVSRPPSLAGKPDDDPAVKNWERAVREAQVSYEALVNSGVPAEDARGLIPQNMTTRVHYFTNLRGLLDHAGNRLCTQAQFEWRQVFTAIIQAIRETALCDAWQASELADLFRPVCYQTGKCEFKANFDRACKIRDRVDANAAIGRPSDRWDTPGGMVAAIHPAEWLLDPSAAR